MPEPDPVLEITLDAYIPDDYIADPRYKMEIYRRCSDLEYEDREDLLDEIIDRFGERDTGSNSLACSYFTQSMPFA